jgi:hypothetical protein
VRTVSHELASNDGTAAAPPGGAGPDSAARIWKLDICLPKCKLYIKGLTLAEAQEEVQKAVEADPALYSLKDILKGMVCVGVLIGSPQFVQAFVAEKSKT